VHICVRLLFISARVCMFAQRDNASADNNEISVDDISVDDHEKQNDWDSRSKEIPGWYENHTS